MIAGLAAFICGVSSFASISIGLRAGFGSTLGMWIFGCSSFTLGSLGSGAFGGGGVFTLISGGGVVGNINAVCSYLCCSITCLAVIPMYRARPRMITLRVALVTNEADRPSGSGSKPKLVGPG